MYKRTRGQLLASRLLAYGRHAAHVLLTSSLVIIALAGWTACAQDAGTVAGRVTDPDGRVVASSTIELTSLDRSRTVTVTSNEQGEFVFNGVQAGNYKLVIHADTFANYVVESLTVDADQNANLVAVMKPGKSDGNITVYAYGSGAPVDTQTATIGTVIDRKLVEGMPVDGGNVVALAAMLPGVTNVSAGTTTISNTGGPAYNASGSRSNQNLYLLDGVVWNNLYQNTGISFPPGYGLQEVSVLLNNYKAQYGRNVGSIFNAVTKSGSDAFHGALWENLENKVLNASDYISKLNPKQVQNQFGASFGGPLWKDKTSFMLTWQNLRLASQVSAQAQTPVAAERGLEPDGVTPRTCISPAFAGLGSCASFPYANIRNPLYTTVLAPTASGAQVSSNIPVLQTWWQLAGNSGTSPCVTLLQSQKAEYLPNNEVPSVCFAPFAVNVMKRWPLATITNGTGRPLASTVAPQPLNEQDGLARVDFHVKRHSISARYYQTAVSDYNSNGASSGVGVASYEIFANAAAIHFGGLDDTVIVTPNLLNVARIAYKRYDYSLYATDPTDINGLGGSLSQPGRPGLPRIQLGNFSVGYANNYQATVDEDVQFDEAVTWSKGRHNVQAGVEYLRLQYQGRSDQTPFLESYTSYTGYEYSDFLFGYAYKVIVGNSTTTNAIQNVLYSYLQDDWRVTPKLTLNLGLRYELPFRWYQPQGQSATFLPGYQSIVYPNAPPNLAYVGDPGIERSLIGTSFNNLAPRLGFAYDVFGNGKTAIRAGFGIFYDAINAQIVGASEPFHYTATYGNTLGGLSEPLLNLNPIPANYSKSQPAVFSTPFSIVYPDHNFQTPYSEAINLGFIQRINEASTIEVDYVAHLGRHLAIPDDQNPAIYDCAGAHFQANPAVYCTNAAATSASYAARVVYPNFNYGGGGAVDYISEGSSSYHSAQVIFISRATKSLTAIMSYTHSKSLDQNSNGTSFNSASDMAPNINANYGVSDFNVTNVFNLGYVLRLPDLTTGPRSMRSIAKDWTISGIYSVRSGLPFSVADENDITLRDEPQEYAQFIPGGYVPLPSNRHRTAKVAEWFNIGAICSQGGLSWLNGIVGGTNVPNSCPNKNGFGNIQRNFFRGPGYITNNFTVRRAFHLPLHESQLQLGVEAFNVFNTPNLGMPATGLSGNGSAIGSIGEITATAGGNGAVATNGRKLQLSALIRY